MSAIGRAIDGLLAAAAPALIVANAVLTLGCTDAPAAKFQAAVSIALFVPWAIMLPVVVALWLRRTGLRSPGRLLAGVEPAERKGGPIGDLLLIAVATVASLPLFYASEILSSETAAILVAAILTVMTVGSLVTLRRARMYERCASK